ncbi:MAG: SpoIIE family protein phosphatase [Phycisphaerae bacterium]|nr:SpoIIE family protein phosphatase [Phycisphaerae bacterium]
MPAAPPSRTLRLVVIAGPDAALHELQSVSHSILGRAPNCDLCLVHETVSRRHAAIAGRGGRWYVTDLGSRHGTYLNGITLVPHKPAEIRAEDLLRIGPWTLRVETAAAAADATIHASSDMGQRVERVPERELAWAAQQRLDLLIETSARINAATSLESLARAALDGALAATGYRRAAWIRHAPGPHQIEIIAHVARTGDSHTFAFSQSLIREAQAGQLARLASDASAEHAHSIISLGIHSALCAPIMLGPSPAAFLYFDARRGETPVHPQAPGFIQAVARMAGLALANLLRVELERRQQRQEADLAIAREAQQMLAPANQGTLGTIRFAVASKPGRVVAGDLFDAVRLDDDRIAFFIGDVTGEGVGSGILMAAGQAAIHAALLRRGDPGLALRDANEYLAPRSALTQFITLWAGVLDGRTGTLDFVDAGHGHWLIRRNAQRAGLVQSVGGIPLGIQPAVNYASEHLALNPGDRIILLSDGLVEQRSPNGVEFGHERVADALQRATDPASDVRAVFDDVIAFARTDLLQDDATAASIEWLGPPANA